MQYLHVRQRRSYEQDELGLAVLSCPVPPIPDTSITLHGCRAAIVL